MEKYNIYWKDWCCFNSWELTEEDLLPNVFSINEKEMIDDIITSLSFNIHLKKWVLKADDLKNIDKYDVYIAILKRLYNNN